MVGFVHRRKLHGTKKIVMVEGESASKPWRRGSKQWSNKSSSAKGWWNEDSMPITCDSNESNTHIVMGSDHVLLVREVLVNGSETFRSVCSLQIFMSSYRCCYYVLFGNTPNIYSTIRIRFTTHSYSD